MKSQTKANLRAALHNVEAADESGTTGKSFSTADAPLQPTPLPSTSWRWSSANLKLHLDIAAPRILLPERLWPYSSDSAVSEAEMSYPPASLLGVICDFGRFRLSNWEPSETNTEGCDSTENVSNPYNFL